MPRQRVRPGDPIFLAGDLSRYAAYGSAGMPVVDRESGESLLLSAAHVVGGLARSSRESAVYTSDATPPTSATQIRIGTTIDSVPSELVDACECDAALVRTVADTIFNRRMDRGSITRYVRAL